MQNLVLKSVLLFIFINVISTLNAQLIFSETFGEINGSVVGSDDVGGVNWTTICPTCIDAGDFYNVQGGAMVGQDSNGPATWETGIIDISSCSFFDISLILMEEGDMEACGTGCTSVDWVQLEFNIDNIGWQTPANSVFCSGGCANLNVIQSDDIGGASLNYSTGCIESGLTLQIRIIVQAWAANERWFVDDVEVNCANGPTINAGVDQNSCGGDITLTAINPDNGVLSWDNGIVDGVTFTPGVGTNTYVVSSDIGGCVATDTIVVNVNPSPVFNITGTNPTTCGGTDGFITLSELDASTLYQISYNDGTNQGPFNMTSDAAGNIVITVLQTGNYTDFFVEFLGCSTLENNIISLIDPSAPTIDAGSAQLVCEGTDVVLSANNPDNALLSWDNGITDGVPFTPFLGTVTYAVTANLNGCISTDLVDVTVTQIPQVNANIDIEVCEGLMVTLTAINPDFSTITWDNGVLDGIAFLPNVGTTTYTVTANLNGCITIDDVDLIVTALPTFIITGNNPTTCLGLDGFITISGLNPITNYEISYSDGINQGPINLTTDAGGFITLSDLTSGNYTDFLVDEIGCSSFDNIIINLVDPLPPLINAGTDENICVGDNVVLLADNPDGAIVLWNNGVIDGIEFMPSIDLYYIATASLNGCTSSDTVNVFVFTAPNVDAGIDQSICIGDDVLLIATNSNGAETVWDNGVIDGVIFSPQSTIIYTVISSIGTCISSDEVQVTVNQGPDATFIFNPNNPSVENTEVIFTIPYSNPSIENYIWDFGDNQTSNLEAPIHFYNEEGGVTYEVILMVTDTAGCVNTSTTLITIDDVLVYYVPNAFTPDGDDLNNIFLPIFTAGFDPLDYHLIIFDRWGEVLFESFNAAIGWDGTYVNGSIVKYGVYVWTIEFGEITSDRQNIIHGHVALVK